MERLRWLPKNLGKRFVFVNQPAFEVQVMDRGQRGLAQQCDRRQNFESNLGISR